MGNVPFGPEEQTKADEKVCPAQPGPVIADKDKADLDQKVGVPSSEGQPVAA
jgi:hypothetical protein